MGSRVSGSITIAVLAGGRSRRMGRDKAMLPLAGERFLERVVRVLLPLGAPMVVAGRERPEEWAIEDVRFLPDAGEGDGPLRGIATALRAVGGDVLVVACDMPMLDAETVAWLIGIADEAMENDGVAVLRGGRLEPLFSLYRHRLLTLIEERIAAGDLSLHGVIDAARFRRVELPERLAGRLRNVNTEEELRELRRELEE